MQIPSHILAWAVRSTALPAVLIATLAAAQSHPATPSQPAVAAQQQATAAPLPSEKDLLQVQEQLITLLRLSPTLTSVVARDPSLLANQDYVSRNNPQLAAFLTSHPEIARNPEFYLFTRTDGLSGKRYQVLEQVVWPEMIQGPRGRSGFDAFLSDMPPVIGFACFFGALIWLIRVFLENRRWGRIFKMQSEVHSKLIDKFSSNQELALYMETEAGKRFLEAAPIPVGFEPEQRMPNAVARVLTPLQIGIVLFCWGPAFISSVTSGPNPKLPC